MLIVKYIHFYLSIKVNLCSFWWLTRLESFKCNVNEKQVLRQTALSVGTHCKNAKFDGFSRWKTQKFSLSAEDGGRHFQKFYAPFKKILAAPMILLLYWHDKPPFFPKKCWFLIIVYTLTYPQLNIPSLSIYLSLTSSEIFYTWK